MLVDLASVIPDGIVAFFVSYSYMDTIVSKWDQMGVLQVTKPSMLLTPSSVINNFDASVIEHHAACCAAQHSAAHPSQH